MRIEYVICIRFFRIARWRRERKEEQGRNFRVFSRPSTTTQSVSVRVSLPLLCAAHYKRQERGEEVKGGSREREEEEEDFMVMWTARDRRILRTQNTHLSKVCDTR